MLDGFVDSLVQSFENSRAGLSEAMIKRGEVEAFVREIYERELPRLKEAVLRDALLTSTERDEMFGRVDEHVRKVVLPAYARLAERFTPAERNDFYLLPEPLHLVERVSWTALGLLLGLFVVEAPFIPLWSKEWMLVFMVGGLVFPNLRRLFALRRYQSALNDLVGHTDDEIWRMDLAYVTSAAARGADSAGNLGLDKDANQTSPGVGAQPSPVERLLEVRPEQSDSRARRRGRVREGDR
jgi:hypothetical protein